MGVVGCRAAGGVETSFDQAAVVAEPVVEATGTGTTVVEKILRFFQVANPAAFAQTWQRPSVSFRRSQAFTIDEPNTALWLRLVERSAGDVRVEPFNPRHLRKVAKEIPRLTTMTVPNGFIAARAAPAGAGIALTFVREVDRTRARAATWWIAADRPAIGITERQRRPDVFWFNLLHEIGHIVRHPRRSSYLNLDDPASRADPAEAEADAFAADMLFPGDASERIARARNHKDPILIAARLGIGVPTVAGRHGNLTKNWRLAGGLRGTISNDDILKLEAAVEDLGA